MTQTQIQVLQVDDMTSPKGQPYAMVHTNIGRMSCWNNGITQTLKQSIGRTITADVATSLTGFNSIKGLGTQMQQAPFVQAQRPFSTGNQGVAKKQSSFELSYAKDIFCALAAGYDNNDVVKKDEHLRYLAELSAELILKMKGVINEETLETQEEEVH